MKISKWIALLALLLPVVVLAQAPPDGDPPPPPARSMGQMHGSMPMGRMGPGAMGHGMPHHEMMGKWWQNSELAKKLQLTDAQIKQLDQTFFDHRMKLIDYYAAVAKEDMKLQSLLDEDSPSESAVGTQVDQVLAARSKLEREDTMMSLDLRKVLTVDQWRQLKDMRQHSPGGRPFAGPRGADPSMIRP